MKRLFTVFISSFILPSLLGFASIARAEDESNNEILVETLDQLAVAVGIPLKSSAQAGKRKLKIAVLDNGFRDFENARGGSLPETTKLRTVPKPVDAEIEEGHGTKVAEILANLLNRTGTKYELHLFPSFGYTNFKSSVETVIAEKFDLVLYSQVWDFGNGDGKGFINNLVSAATKSGVTWVNATGNFEKGTYRAPIERTIDDGAALPGPNGSVQIRCFKNSSDICHLRVLLTWNSFSDDVRIGTDKDLDLVLTDSTSKVIGSSALIQTSTGTSLPGASFYPREEIKVDVKPGLYFARVRIRSANFTKTDELKILVNGDFTELLNRREGEALLPPSDNWSVITVGASDTDQSSLSRSMGRPDLSAPSLIKTADGGMFKGSSNAAAAYAARIAFELSKVPSIDRESLLIKLRGGTPRPKTIPQDGIERTGNPAAIRDSSSLANLDSTSPGCYFYHALQITVPHVRKMLKEGGVVVDTLSGPKIFIDESPFTRASRLGLEVELQNADGSAGSILVADASGLYATSVEQRAGLASDTVEIVRTPPNAKFCRLR